MYLANLNTLLLQSPAPEQGTSGGAWWITILMYGMVIWVFYHFIIRPQNKEKNRLKTMRDEMKKGDRVVTAGGIHGRVQKISRDKKTVTLQVADKVNIEFAESAVSTVLDPSGTDK